MILHVDMDAFYASVEERENPDLVGKPLIVGGSKDGRGVVAAANYAARKFGIHSAMPARRAFELCPHLISVRPRMAYYAEASKAIRKICYRFTPVVEPLSLDEAFLDVTGCEKLFGSPVEIARQIKQMIFSETRLIASVGIAPNKFLAKIASDLEKPDALVVVDPNRIQEFLDPLPIGRIWGVGKVTSKVFQRLRVATIEDLRSLDPNLLNEQFGSQADHFFRLCRGIDERQVIPDRNAKSISHERTFETDLIDRDVLRAWVRELTDQVARRLRRHQRRGSTVQVKIRFANFRTITRAKTLREPTHQTDAISRVALELLEQGVPNRHEGIRLLGVGVSHFDRSEKIQKSLFDIDETRKQGRLDAVSDEIQDRFGHAALARASRLLNDLPGERMHADDGT